MENLKQELEFQKEKFKKFTYRDNSKGGIIIFECLAENILEADKKYQEKTGNDPEKQMYVGCSIEKPPEDADVLN